MQVSQNLTKNLIFNSLVYFAQYPFDAILIHDKSSAIKNVKSNFNVKPIQKHKNGKNVMFQYQYFKLVLCEV